MRYTVNMSGVPICTMEDGPNGTGSQLAFYRTRDDIMNHDKAVLIIYFDSALDVVKWLQLNYQMSCEVYNGLVRNKLI